MNRRMCLALIGFSALAVTGCGTTSPAGNGADASAPANRMTGAAPLDAALVTPYFGWVLTPDQLLITRDGGATLTAVNVPLPVGDARTAYFSDANNGVAASVSGIAITAARTSDGGRTWHSSTVRDPSASPAGYSSVRMSFGDASNGAILARTATSPAFSLGTLFATTDGGATWSARPAPEAGQVSVEPGGRVWVAGNALNLSDDQGRHWTQAQLHLAGPADAMTVSTPVAGKLPVTVVTGGRTEVELLTTADQGRTWGHGRRLPVRGRTGSGVRLAVAGTGAGIVVFDNVAGHVYRATNGTDLRPSGLPEGVHTVTFAGGGAAGWALATYGTCAQDKQDCVLHNDLVETTDGGASWQTLAVWARPVR